MHRTLIVGALSSALLCAGCQTYDAGRTTGTQTAQAVASRFHDAPVMIRIAECESGMRQYDAQGRVVRGAVHRPDSGVFQINAAVHRAKARAMGYDIDTTDGNVAYAKYLYEAHGTAPWHSSRRCWARH